MKKRFRAKDETGHRQQQTDHADRQRQSLQAFELWANEFDTVHKSTLLTFSSSCGAALGNHNLLNAPGQSTC
jgi:hypothetical protein